ncbi:MAG: AAA family ATPase [Kiloniellales bacterium]|nr:AAA family ATPase [Kiloniellales bacterium]
MDYLAAILIGVAMLLLFLARHVAARQSGKAEATKAAEGSAKAEDEDGEASAPGSEIYDIASRLADFYRASAHPTDLLESNADFEAGVRLLCAPEIPVTGLGTYVTGDNAILSSMALEAMTRREDAGGQQALVLGCIGTIAAWPQYFALRYLARRTPSTRPLVGEVLVRTAGYLDYRLSRGFITDFCAERIEAGEAPGFDGVRAKLDGDDRATLEQFLESLDAPFAASLLENYKTWRARQVDQGLLRSAGQIWDEADSRAAAGILEHDQLRDAVEQLEAALLAERPQSCLIVGEAGVGKTTILRKLASRLHEKGWVIFTSGHNDLVAGQIYIGQFEERLKEVIAQLRGDRRVVWFIPEFHTLAVSGRHKYSPTGALDAILPLIDQGELKIVGETQPAALERLLQQQPKAVTALAALRVQPLPPADTLALGRLWMEREVEAEDPELVTQAWDLTQQYLGDRAAPGNLLGLLDATLHRLRGGSGEARPRLSLDDVLATLAGQTGLQIGLLDHRRGLDLDGLKDFLAGQVMGQDEAVDCLVERVAMLKAGVTDPTRPVGVFLFAGPTGTGKTELAKTLAEWLFGDPRRMIRMDMSEFQTPDSLDRLIGQSEKEHSLSLADQIRRQPFSILLLDEFEKAHPKVWDTFLQVFDDARITDRDGKVADFRHAIIILTSNLGARIPTGVSLGFGAGNPGFDVGEVRRAVGREFRREFINRLDRVVVFRPLSRELMREILQKELVTAFQRRGLRYRSWAVEWDETAIEFLLEKGFTPDLGARPLKRAIERYLLSPLAVTIVRHQAPEGDQFLFVSSGEDRLEVTFVDPDAPAPAPEDEGDVAAEAAPARLSPRAILLDPRGKAEELAALRQAYELLDAILTSADWQARKDTAMAEMERPDFWSLPERFATLGLAEYLDRVQAGCRRAGSLLRRLEGNAPRGQVPANMVGVLAQNLFLLDEACRDILEARPAEAFLMVEASADGTQDWSSCRDFAGKLAAMYEAWATARRMRFTCLECLEEESKPAFRKVYAVMGFGAHSLLAGEHGLHLFEWPAERPRNFERVGVHVRVAPQALGPPPEDRRALLRQAQECLQGAGEGDLTVVRRYREKPTPLVRDARRDWRSGRLDRVLAGNFDLMV